MEFRLVYQGELKANGDKNHKHEIRREFHKQLKALWSQPPLNNSADVFLASHGELSLIKNIGHFQFAPLVSEKLHFIAEINILFLRPEAPGHAISQSGDIDNRLKTLFDALRMPKNTNELPSDAIPGDSEKPFFCLLEDDALITSIAVITDRWLASETDVSHPDLNTLLVLHVRIKATEGMIKTLGLV